MVVGTKVGPWGLLIVVVAVHAMTIHGVVAGWIVLTHSRHHVFTVNTDNTGNAIHTTTANVITTRAGSDIIDVGFVMRIMGDIR